MKKGLYTNCFVRQPHISATTGRTGTYFLQDSFAAI